MLKALGRHSNTVYALYKFTYKMDAAYLAPCAYFNSVIKIVT